MASPTAAAAAALGNEDLYAVLGVARTAEPEEIRRAFRQQALKYHPDKNPGKPEILPIYEKITKANEVLSDPAARAAYDNVLLAKHKKAERTQKLDSKRRKLAEELQERERQAAQKRQDELEAHQELERQLYRLRQEGRRQAQEQEVRDAMREAEPAATAGDAPASAPAPVDVTANDMDRTLRAKWPPKFRQLDAKQLRDIFGKLGEVEDVVSRKPGSALVVFKSIVHAHAAMSAAANGTTPHTELLDGIALTWAGGAEPPVISTFVSKQPEPAKVNVAASGLSWHDYENITFMRLQQAAERRRAAAAGAGPGSPAGSGGTASPAATGSLRDYENLTMRTMRQEAERQRLRDELAREDAEGAPGSAAEL